MHLIRSAKNGVQYIHAQLHRRQIQFNFFALTFGTSKFHILRSSGNIALHCTVWLQYTSVDPNGRMAYDLNCH